MPSFVYAWVNQNFSQNQFLIFIKDLKNYSTVTSKKIAILQQVSAVTNSNEQNYVSPLSLFYKFDHVLLQL